MENSDSFSSYQEPETYPPEISETRLESERVLVPTSTAHGELDYLLDDRIFLFCFFARGNKTWEINRTWT